MPLPITRRATTLRWRWPSKLPKFNAMPSRDLARLHMLFQQNAISHEELVRASLLLAPYRWGDWLWRGALFLGSALLLCGAVMLFAYNGNQLSDLQKFLSLEGIIGSLIGVAIWRSPRQLVGQLAMVAASVVLGILLAVFGQTYQTGADSWQLFATWALLMLPWLTLGQFAPQWLLQISVTSVAVALWMSAQPWRYSALFPILGWFYLLALAWVHIAGARLLGWLKLRWLYGVHALAAHFGGVALLLWGLLSAHWGSVLLACLGAVALVFYSHHSRQLALQMLGAFFALGKLWILLDYLLYKAGFVGSIGLLFNALMSIVVTVLLLRLYPYLKTRTGDAPSHQDA